MDIRKLYKYTNIFCKFAENIDQEKRNLLVTEVNSVYNIISDMEKKINSCFSVWIGVDIRYQKDIQKISDLARSLKNTIDENSDSSILPNIKQGAEGIQSTIGDLKTCSYLNDKGKSYVTAMETSVTKMLATIAEVV